MKQCPQCERSYADDTLSFCLADGQLLSRSYEAAATLPLATARVTNDPVTEILPVALSPIEARKKIRRNWIAGAVGIPIGAIIMLITLTNAPDGRDQPTATLAAAASFGALIFGYMFWSSFWGFPKVWSWWLVPVKKLYQLANRMSFTPVVAVVLIVAALFALAPAIVAALVYFYSLFWVGLFYSFFGGGVYQFIQARKIARENQ